ncbi:hypothetical protein HPB50_008113 [Hyalomma asiaticum]|uniref:Uncharacterized protein n=1 Tax=Hyalomma asiaticum TaxID=266040 RepID=A0ACB7S7J2_HYAAI|nr:hypothetical protein HPB50_008113 [Hyalomma asiaticum]
MEDLRYCGYQRTHLRRVLPGRKDQQEETDLRDCRAILVHRGHEVHRVKPGSQDHRGTLDRRDLRGGRGNPLVTTPPHFMPLWEPELETFQDADEKDADSRETETSHGEYDPKGEASWDAADPFGADEHANDEPVLGRA